MTKINNIYEAVDDFGLISSAEALDLGMSNAEMVQHANRGNLVRVARGVYRMPIWPSHMQDPYAIALKSVGKDACLYAETVIAMLNLAPTDPNKIWIACPRRVRKNLGSGIYVIKRTDIVPVLISGLYCQPLYQAIISSVKTLGHFRASQAAQAAISQGLLSAKEKAYVKKELKV